MIKGTESLVDNIQFWDLNIIYLHISNPTFGSKPHYNLTSGSWFKRYEQFFEFQNIVKDRNMSSVLAYNSKSTLATSNSFPLIMSHIKMSRFIRMPIRTCHYWRRGNICAALFFALNWFGSKIKTCEYTQYMCVSMVQSLTSRIKKQISEFAKKIVNRTNLHL